MSLMGVRGRQNDCRLAIFWLLAINSLGQLITQLIVPNEFLWFEGLDADLASPVAVHPHPAHLEFGALVLARNPDHVSFSDSGNFHEARTLRGDLTGAAM